MRVATVETRRGNEVRFDKDGHLKAVDGQSLRIVTSIYAALRIAAALVGAGLLAVSGAVLNSPQ